MTRPTRYAVYRGIAKYSRRIVIILLVIIIGQLAYLDYQTAEERIARVQYVDNAICALVRAVPPGNRRIDTVRRQLRCGKYQPGRHIPIPHGIKTHKP